MTDAFPDRAAIEAGQLDALRRLLAAIVPANPFWTRHLADAGVGPDVASLAAFTAAVPLVDKAALRADQEAHPPYGTNLTFPLERYTRLHQTSSTTGAPLRWLDTPESWAWMVDGWVEILEAAGVGPGDRLLAAFSFGPFIGFWLAFEAAQRRGALCIPGGAMNSATRLRVMLANEVTVLCCTPTYALRLSEVAREDGIDLARAAVRVIIAAGEPGASVPATRARLEAAWPTATIFDHHGMTEVGPVTYQCPQHPGRLHVMEERYLCEVIDPESGAPRPADAEARGELVLTPLGRAASPLLRYRTGDLVHALPADRCGCGRWLRSLEGGILDRTDDMVIVRGVNLYPSAVQAVIDRFAEVAEYRVEVDATAALAELRVAIEPAGGDADALARRVEAAFRDAFNLRIPVTTAAPGTLPRFELKARRWVRREGE